MILNKITTGFVVQQFDTQKGVFTRQEFVAGDKVAYEHFGGNPVQEGSTEETLIHSAYLHFDMVQPTEEE